MNYFNGFITIMIILILVVYMYYICSRDLNELFVSGYGTSFSKFYKPKPECRDSNNCFKGFTSRFSSYQNLCEPQTVDSNGDIKKDNLLKSKRQLRDLCVRTLE